MEPEIRTLAVPGAPPIACIEWDDGENRPVMALLTDSGCPANVMADMAESFGGEYRIVAPLPDARIREAVRELALDGTAHRREVSVALAVVLSHASAALPMLRSAHAESTGVARRHNLHGTAPRVGSGLRGRVAIR